jgi:hypothetical protein
MNLATPNLELRAAVSAYVVFGIIFGFITLMTGLPASSEPSMRLPFLIFAAVWVFCYAWLFTFRLVVSSESIAYRTLLRGTRTLRLQDIKSMKVESGIREYSDRFKPFIRLVIVSSGTPCPCTINVNLKVFSSSDIRQLLDSLQTQFRSMGMPGVVKEL